MIAIPVTVASDDVVFSVTVNPNSENLSVTAGADFYVSTYPDYEGSLEFMPSNESQTISTRDMVVHGDIVIDPIPSNYGKIDWDGVTITVS